jgi:NAD(P)H-dependent FMN reductase
MLYHPRMKIVVLIAGTNEPSNSALLADAFIKGIERDPGNEISRYLVRDIALPHFTVPDYASDANASDLFREVKKKILEADGVAIATPIWNFSVPAHLKNFIDWMGTFGLDAETHSKGQFGGKPFALIQTGGAPMIAWKALMYLTTLHLPEAIKYYGGTVVLRHFEPKCVAGRGKFGLVVDQRPESLAAMERKGETFAGMTRDFAQNRRLPFLQQLRYRFFTFLYRVGNRIMYPLSVKQ